VRYLRAVSRALLNVALPAKEKAGAAIVPSVVRELLANAVLAPAMDAIADPDVVNYLLLLVFGPPSTGGHHVPRNPIDTHQEGEVVRPVNSYLL
jgi:hypothetical protein